MSPEIGLCGIAAIFFILGILAGALWERGRWKHRARALARYLDEQAKVCPLNVEKEIYQSTARVLRVFSRKRV